MFFGGEGDTSGAGLLRDTKVGEFVSLEALGGGRGVEEADRVEEGEEEGRAPYVECIFPLSFLSAILVSFLFLSFLFSKSMGGKRSGSPTVVAGHCGPTGFAPWFRTP